MVYGLRGLLDHVQLHVGMEPRPRQEPVIIRRLPMEDQHAVEVQLSLCPAIMVHVLWMVYGQLGLLDHVQLHVVMVLKPRPEPVTIQLLPMVDQLVLVVHLSQWHVTMVLAQ